MNDVVKPWQFKPGQSGNPAGRPQGSRNKLSEAALSNMLESWGNRGVEVLDRLATDDPATYARLAFSVIPKDVAISVEQRGAGIDPEEWQLLRPLLVAILEARASGSLDEIVQRAEHAIRAEFATPIES